MKKLVLVAVLLVCAVAWAGDRSSEVDRLESAATVLDEVMSGPDAGIPNSVIESAKCIAVVPSMLKAGFVFGASYGKGVASCYTDHGWSAPAFFRLEGGSFGLQIGGQAVDVVMLIMNDQGMRSLLTSKFKLGADASVAGGPVGREAAASSDITLRAQILTYSRARGAFAGVTLNGASVRQDRNATRDFYGRVVLHNTLLRGGVEIPPDAKTWVDTLTKWSGRRPLRAAPSAAPATAAAPASTPAATPAPAAPVAESNQPPAEKPEASQPETPQQ